VTNYLVLLESRHACTIVSMAFSAIRNCLNGGFVVVVYYLLVKSLRAMSTNSLFLPHKVMYHIALGKCYHYVTHNFMWMKKRVLRHCPNSFTLFVYFLMFFLCVFFLLTLIQNLRPRHKIQTWMTIPGRQFQHLSIQFTANRGPAQRNGFHNSILFFYAESDSVNNASEEKSIRRSIC